MHISDDAQDDGSGAGERVHRRAYYLFALLWLAVLISFIDKTIMSLLLTAIQADLALSDSQLGILAGAAFGVTYMVGALTNATLADRTNRVRLIAAMVTVWSFATLACGVAHGFLVLVACRAVVGFAEGGLNPTSASLIGDTFPRRQRASALAVLFSAVGAGIMATFVVGGPLLHWLDTISPLVLPLVGEVAHWQAGFMLAGLPGLALGVLLLSTVREPPRGGAGAVNATGVIAWSDVRAYLMGHERLYTGILVGMPLTVLGAYSLMPWMPVLLKRAHDWDVASVGIVYGLTSGSTIIIGSMVAGRIVSAMRSRGYSDASYRFCIASSFWLAGFCALGALLPQPVVSVVFVAVGFLMFMVPPAMMYAVINEVAPNRMRARLGSLALISAGLLLNSLGPWLVGVMNDHVFNDRGATGLSVLVLSVPSVALGAFLMLRGLPQYASAAAESRRRAATDAEGSTPAPSYPARLGRAGG